MCQKVGIVEITKENIDKLAEASNLLSECGMIAEQLNEKKSKAEGILTELDMDEASEVDYCDDFSSFEILSCNIGNKCTDYECELEFGELQE